MVETKRKSRWVRNSGVPRYDKATEDYIINRYREQPEWHNGARVRKR